MLKKVAIVTLCIIGGWLFYKMVLLAPYIGCIDRSKFSGMECKPDTVVETVDKSDHE